jgi:hypothetical protein
MTICRGQSKGECRKKSLPYRRSILAAAEFIQTDLGLNLATNCLRFDTVFTFCVQHTFHMTHQLLHVSSLVMSYPVIYSVLGDMSVVDSLGDVSPLFSD